MNIKAKDMAKMKASAKRGYALGLVSALVMAWVLSRFVVAGTFMSGATVGFWIWLGFIATVTLGGVLWEGKPWNLYLLNAAYWLVALLLTGGILAMW